MREDDVPKCPLRISFWDPSEIPPPPTNTHTHTHVSVSIIKVIDFKIDGSNFFRLFYFIFLKKINCKSQ